MPTPDGQYEIYLFANGVETRGDTNGDAGLDFNYGAARDLQLTVVVPLSYDDTNGHLASGLGNIEIAAKYRFLHQESFGWDVAFFPRVFLRSGSDLGDHGTSLLLPIWLGKDLGDWSTFGGGGCVLARGDDLQNYCLAGWAVTRKFAPDLQVGVEIFHQTPDTKGERASTTLGFGATYDLNENLHFLGYVAAGLQNADETGRIAWYASILFTF